MNTIGKSESLVPEEYIMSKILVVRGQKVMIDRDLAELFGIETKRLNEQVKRNIKRFPPRFMFQLTIEEKDEVVANCDHMSNLKFSPFLPYVFTEHGTVMLANVLNSERAIQTSIFIVEAFIKLREMFSDSLNLKIEIDEIKHKIQSQDKNIELVFSYLDELMDKQTQPKERKRIGFIQEG
jgi:hypothetical protein